MKYQLLPGSLGVLCHSFCLEVNVIYLELDRAIALHELLMKFLGLINLKDTVNMIESLRCLALNRERKLILMRFKKNHILEGDTVKGLISEVGYKSNDKRLVSLVEKSFRVKTIKEISNTDKGNYRY